MRLRLLTTLLLASACSDSVPCTNCPPLAGTYAVWWSEPIAEGPCEAPNQRPRTLEFSLAGARAQVTIDGLPLAGTVDDSWSFSLNGVADDVSANLRGLVIPAWGDAGVRVTATYTTRSEVCETIEKLTAERPWSPDGGVITDAGVMP